MLQDQSDEERMHHNQNQAAHDTHPHIHKRLPQKQDNERQ